MKNYTTIIITLLLSCELMSQGGIELMAGLSNVSNRSEMITPSGMNHHGYFAGLDASFNEGDMYLLLGGQYHQHSFMPQKSAEYFSHDHSMSWFKIRAGLGFNLINFGKNTRLKLKALGSINILTNYPKNLLDEPYNSFNSSTAAASASAILEFRRIGIGLEYEHGFFNAINEIKETEFDFWNAFLAFRF